MLYISRIKENKIYFALFFLTIVFFSCKNEENSKQKTHERAQKRDLTSELSQIDNILSQIDSTSQYYVVSSKAPSKVVGKKGTVIYINPLDLETDIGTNITDSIRIELKELHTQAELAISNAQTISRGKLLESGGAYYINLTSSGKNLQIRQGKTLKAEFPKISDKSMSLFYGSHDTTGNMSWTESNTKFSVKQENDTISIKSAPMVIPDTGISTLIITTESGNVYQMSEYEFQKRKLIDSEFCCDSCYSIRRNYRMVGPNEETLFRNKGNEKIFNSIYEAIEINKLGWINCDRFYDIENKTNMTVSFENKDNIESAVLFLVFKDINSVMKNYFLTSDKLNNTIFKDVPVGQKVKLISISVKNNEVFTYYSELTIDSEKTIKIKHEKSSVSDINKLFRI